jgi:hypothetical protein
VLHLSQSNAHIFGVITVEEEPSTVEEEPSTVEEEPSTVEEEPSTVEEEPSSVRPLLLVDRIATLHVRVERQGRSRSK